jgi:hypothetical protein
MNFEAVVIPFFAGLIASKGFITVDVAAANALVVAHPHRKAIHDVDRTLIQVFPDFTQGVKDGPDQFGQTMQTTIEAAPAQQVLDIAMLVQKTISFRLIAAKVQCGRHCNRHDFCITDPTLAIFSMVKCLQNIVTQAEYCYNLAVHVASRFVVV